MSPRERVGDINGHYQRTCLLQSNENDFGRVEIDVIQIEPLVCEEWVQEGRVLGSILPSAIERDRCEPKGNFDHILTAAFTKLWLQPVPSPWSALCDVIQGANVHAAKDHGRRPVPPHSVPSLGHLTTTSRQTLLAVSPEPVVVHFPRREDVPVPLCSECDRLNKLHEFKRAVKIGLLRGQLPLRIFTETEARAGFQVGSRKHQRDRRLGHH
mmetsp:Transcript_56064/g.149573  ORF Transcript_56064/g.149573 Transcript_56064/m.149573 type:complete len:212 (-) Transcript_56064:167-802(-)